MTTDFTKLGLVHDIAGSAHVGVEAGHVYPTEAGPLAFDLYRPPHAAGPLPAVVFVSGYPDPGMAAMLGRPLKDWESYRAWARLVAASGLIAITYLNNTPADGAALLRHLHQHGAELGVDPARIGLWACSGNGPTALELLAHQAVSCAALLYPVTIDVDGATGVAELARQIHFALPALTLAELPRERPLLLVRAGRDTTPGLDPALLRFVAAARAHGLALTVLEHAEAPHAFDLLDDSPRTHELIDEVLGFLQRTLTR
ncbi:MAG: hypothetical protein IT370_18405 [Deltaproteobacteria bacterium]|nr:hypothetical protein [Deltaproteobacteria bacterium]